MDPLGSMVVGQPQNSPCARYRCDAHYVGCFGSPGVSTFVGVWDVGSRFSGYCEAWNAHESPIRIT